MHSKRDHLFLGFKYEFEIGTMVDYYLIYGPEFDQIIASYRPHHISRFALGQY